MKRVILLGLAALGLCSGCDDGDHLQIVRFAEVGRGENQCVANMDAPPATPHILDVGIAGTDGYRGYIAAPVIQNDFAASEELDAVNIFAVDVELISDQLPPEALKPAETQYRVFATGVLIRPGQSASVIVEVLPQPIAKQLAAVMDGSSSPTVRAVIRAVGVHDGEEVIGTPSELPIEVCKYCLTPEPVACPSAGFAAASVFPGGCQPSQDQPVTCCNSQQSLLLCGSAVPTRE